MDSLNSLLSRHPLPEEPAEVRLIKHYIDEQFHSSAHISLREHDIIIGVRSSALANALRLRLPELERICGTDKKLVIRVGQAG